jgi:cytochrome c-type biogenesis protein CcmH/NrfG
MKRILTVVTIILIASATTLISQPQLDKANDLLKQKKPAEAITVCQSYIKTSPKDENGWLILAKACLQIGMLDSAENSAKKAVDLDDEMLDGYAILGQAQIAKKNFQDAAATARMGLSKIKKKNPKYPPLLVVLGQSLLATGSPSEALVSAAEAKEIDPKYAEAYEVMGDAYAAQNVSAMAFDSYEKSLEIDTTQSRVLYKLAKNYTKERQYTDAARIYSRIDRKSVV